MERGGQGTLDVGQNPRSAELITKHGHGPWALPEGIASDREGQAGSSAAALLQGECYRNHWQREWVCIMEGNNLHRDRESSLPIPQGASGNLFLAVLLPTTPVYLSHCDNRIIIKFRNHNQWIHSEECHSIERSSPLLGTKLSFDSLPTGHPKSEGKSSSLTAD